MNLNAAAGRQPSRCEIVLVTLVVIFGVALRIAYPSRMSVEHFDEGVYASSIWFGAAEDYQYPNRHLYAPPLLPGLIEWSIVLLGHRQGAMVPSVLAGCLTLLLVWWMAREWFGPIEAVASTTLASFSDFHQLYSRTALTDVLLVMWLLLATLFLARALSTHKPAAVLAAGVVTGLAWWTKYNGWLPLAIGLAGLILLTIMHAKNRQLVLKAWLCWLSVSLIALIVWCPVLISLYETWGGYHVVSENHRQYLVGLSGWWGSFSQQVANHWHFDGWLSCLGLGVAMLFAGSLYWFDHRGGISQRNQYLLKLYASAISITLVAAAAAIGSSAILGLLTVVAISFLLKSENYRSGNRSTVVVVLTVWFFGLLLATPFYRPYARLTLPWLACSWLGAGVCIGRLVQWLQASAASTTSGGIHRGPLTGAIISLSISVILLIWFAPRLTSKAVPALVPRNGFEWIATEIHRETELGEAHDPAGRSGDAEVYVYGEPGLFFQLKVAGVKLMAVDELDFHRETTVPTFLVTGPHAHRSRQFEREWTEQEGLFSLIATYPYEASDLVLLNHYHPNQLRDPELRPREEVRLYRLK